MPGAAQDQRFGEVVALEQIEAQVHTGLGLGGRIHLLGQQYQRALLQPRHHRRKPLQAQRIDVDLDHVDHVEHCVVGIFMADIVVQRDAEAGRLECLEALDQCVVDIDGFQDFEHHAIARQQLDHVAVNQGAREVDEAQVRPEHRLDAQLRERMIDDRGRGDEIIVDLRIVGVPGTEQQLERGQILVAVEDRLAAEQQFARRHARAGSADQRLRTAASRPAPPPRWPYGRPPGCGSGRRCCRLRTAARSPAWCWTSARGRSRRHTRPADRRW